MKKADELIKDHISDSSEDQDFFGSADVIVKDRVHVSTIRISETKTVIKERSQTQLDLILGDEEQYTKYRMQ